MKLLASSSKRRGLLASAVMGMLLLLCLASNTVPTANAQAVGGGGPGGGGGGPGGGVVVLPETAAPTDAPDFPDILPETAAPTPATPALPIETSPPTPAVPALPIETDAPTPAVVTTAAPVATPVETAAPVVTPVTARPTFPARITDPPTVEPVVVTAAPTTPPGTSTPTSAPVTTAPTFFPTVVVVTPEPTVDDTTLSPTAAPVTAAPVVTSPPTTLTQMPTSNPTTATPTAAPVTATAAPTFALRSDTVQGLGIALDGVKLPMTDESIATFESTYALHCESFFEADVEQVSQDMEEFSTTITYVSDSPLRRRRLGAAGGGGVGGISIRSVQETSTGSTLVTYDQSLEYRADPDAIDLQKAVEAPFKTPSRRQVFTDLLVESGDPAYADLQGVGKLVAPGQGGDGAEGKSTNTTAIIAGVCGGIGGLLLLGGGYMLYKKSKAKSVSKKGAMLEDDEKPPSQLQLSTVGGDDAVSTLAEPAGRPSGTQSGEDLAGYGDQSVNTVDYDYSKAYGGGGEASVVSSAGGTLGQQTSGGGTLGSGGAAAAGLAAGAAGASIFSDDASFEQNYGQNVSVKEEMIEIYAPPGKLGVVIDTPDEGAPVVHAVKDSSCIADQLNVGDKLIAVDDEDVRAMTAIKVSKMISRKSANAQRKLTVVRTTVSE